MTKQDEVVYFLQEFKAKMAIWPILFRDDRGKNMATLSVLEITPLYREKVLSESETKDFSEGPLPELLHGGADMWVFGKEIKKQEVYIKISLGKSTNAICISFHLAEHKMKYPFK